MGKEIERKFLVRSSEYRQGATPVYYRQGYIPTLNGMTVRIRIAGDQGYVTFKDRTVGMSRHEFEYAIPRQEAEQMLELMCPKPQIEKERYTIPAGLGKRGDSSPIEGLHWEVDEFHGENEGLVVAEIEVPEEDASFPLPQWIGKEITGNKKYYNSLLCSHPYKTWEEK